jgi:hypothetical protein
MRRRIVISAVVMVLVAALLAAIGYFGLGWWQPAHETVVEKTGGFDSTSEPTTLPAVLAIAHEALDQFGRAIHDYSGVIVKRERIGTDLVTTVIFAKIREEPFSVYLNFLDRSNDKGVKGREVVYLRGKNNGNLISHTPGLLGGFQMPLAPTNFLATRGERYPITEIGLANLCRQLIKRGEAVGDPSQVKVKRFPKARVNARACTLLQVMYPVHDEPKNWGYLARVFLDKEWKIPIRVEVYELPADRGKMPSLVEEYTYLDLKLNNGYSDADFDVKNRQYKFPR